MTTISRDVELPPGLTHRRPTVADAAQILELTVACDLRVLGESDSTFAQIEGDLGGSGVDNERGGRLVEDAAGDVVGWLWTEASEAADEVFVDLYSLEQPVLRWLLARAFDYVELLARERGRPMQMHSGSYEHDVVYGGLLESAGLEVVRRFWHMKRSLDGVPPEPPALPQGVRIRVADADDETERRLIHRLVEETFADHWNHIALPFEEWNAFLEASPGKDPSQWWIAEVDGVPAGIAIGANTQAEIGSGYVRNLGVLRDFRGRGIAKALLAYAFADFVRRGYTGAALGVDSESPTGATRLYEGMGMSIDKVILARRRTVEP